MIRAIYWNTSGSGTRGGSIVRSEQARYGYVIGTSGSRSGVSITTGGNTAPADHLEGVGIGETLEPSSLYLDQLAKRAQGILLTVGEGGTVPPGSTFPLTATAYSYGNGPISYQWTQLGGPAATIAEASSPTTTVEVIESGTYLFELSAVDGSLSRSAQVVVTVDDSIIDPTLTPATLVAVDGIIGRSQQNAPAPGYYLDPPVDVTFTIDSGAALALLQSYYTGNIPNWSEAAFRFNLDQLFPEDVLTGSALNRYILNHAVATDGFQIQSLPAPGVTFDDWIAGFQLGGLSGFGDDPDGGGPAGGPSVGFLAEAEGALTTVTATASEDLPRMFLRDRVSRE